tara:strand:+ start:3423 stop:3905 length:483 start_codon:yes stop_codon:yes gene_type:complete
MSKLYKKVRLFGENGSPIIYRDTQKRLLIPRPRLNRINKKTGLKTSRSLSTARTDEEREYVREVAKYYAAIGNFKDLKKLVKHMSPTERRTFFGGLTVPQLLEYFASIPGAFEKSLRVKLSKVDLVNMAVKSPTPLNLNIMNRRIQAMKRNLSRVRSPKK